MRKEKPMIFLRWRKVKAVAAEQTSVGRNLRSISEQAISLNKQKGGYRGLSFGKKGGRGGRKGAEMEENRWSTFVGSPVEQSGNRIDNFTSFLDYRIRGSPRRSCRRCIAFLPPSKNFSKIANCIPQLFPQDQILQVDISEYLIVIYTKQIFI